MRYVERKENVADVFNRPMDPPALNAIWPARPGIDYEQTAKAQQLDLDLQETSLDNPTSLSLKKVFLGDTGTALLCDDSHGRLRPFIPSSMRLEVFRHFHSGSHPGIKAGIRHKGRSVVWYDMRTCVGTSLVGREHVSSVQGQKLVGTTMPHWTLSGHLHGAASHMFTQISRDLSVRARGTIA